MNSRERVEAALNHQTPDYVPLDLGGSPVTGMQVSCVYQLRQALKLDEPDTPVKVIEPYQMLGEIAPDLLDAIGADVIGLGGRGTMFGFKNENWKPWNTFDGTANVTDLKSPVIQAWSGSRLNPIGKYRLSLVPCL